MTAIKTLRKTARMTQSSLANRLSVTQSAVSQWETGLKKPTLWNLLAMAELFDCSIYDLIEEEERACS